MVDHKEAVTQHTASRYVLGELSPAEREDFEEHYFGCMQCAEDVRTIMALSSNAKTAFLDLETASALEQLSPRPRGVGLRPALRGLHRPRDLKDWFHSLLAWRLPAYAAVPACALLVLTTYQSITLRHQIAPQAIAEFALRPDARGEETVIPVAQRGPHILLSAEPPGTAPEWKWQIRSADSQTALMEGTAPAPPPGFALTLLVPASKFKAGQYVLSLHAERNTNFSPAEAHYRFRMQ